MQSDAISGSTVSEQSWIPRHPAGVQELLLGVRGENSPIEIGCSEHKKEY